MTAIRQTGSEAASAGENRGRGAGTRARILDAAERLFADRGFDGVTIRQIARAAGVQLALVNFHGGAKKELFHTVVERRASELAKRRLEALDKARKAAPGGVPDLRAVMESFVMPYIDAASSGGIQWRAYAKLIAHVAADARWQPIARRLYDPAGQVFIEAIVKALPGADRSRVEAAFVMMVAAMLSTVTSNWRIDGLRRSGERVMTMGRGGTGKALKELGPVLVDFCVGGLEKSLVTGPGQMRR